MQALESLACDDCALTGVLPNWQGPARLQRLSLAANTLSGSLPRWTGMPFAHVNIRFNQLQGLFAAGQGSWPPLTTLVKLNLRGNAITGSLTPGRARLGHLDRLGRMVHAPYSLR